MYSSGNKINNILFVVDRMSQGGAERVVAALANEMFLHKGKKIFIATYSQTKEEYYLHDGITRFCYQKIRGGRIKKICNRFFYLQKCMRETNCDCVISLGTPRITFMVCLARFFCKKIKLIVSERNDPRQFPCGIFWRVLRTLSYYLCDGIVFQTDEAKSFFSDRIQRRSTVILNPITESLPLRFDGPRESRIVNFCRLEKQKNLPLLIEAFAIIAKDFPNYILEIYGDGSEKNHLKELIALRHLEDKIFLKGFCSDIHNAILKASLFVSSSNYEGISNSMLEAMALGIPAICTDCPAGGARMVIENEVNGMLVPVGNVEVMSETMKYLLANKNLHKKISEKSAKIRESLDVDVISGKWITFCERC